MRKITVALLLALITHSAFAQDSTFRFTTSDGVSLHVRIAGKGKPCVFVHGGPGSTSYYYEAMAGAPFQEEPQWYAEKIIHFAQHLQPPLQHDL